MLLSIVLLISVVLPVAASLLVLLVPADARWWPRWAALAASCLTLAAALLLVVGFAPGAAGVQMDSAVNWPWLASADIRFHLGLDGLSLWLFALTALLCVMAVLVSWESIREQTRAYYSLMLMLETGMLGVFAAQDIMLFYVFFEFTLIPLYFVIGIWGGPERRLAARKFFIYTLAGSVLTFIGLVYIVAAYYQQSLLRGAPELTFSIVRLTQAVQDGLLRFSPAEQWWLFLALMAGFAIKVPLFPFHTWLPLAHVEAPTAGSVILAGVLLKIGTYGFLRFSLPLLPEASVLFLEFVGVLAVIGIIYGALVALAQADVKRLIAYSSVSHLGYCMLGLFALNATGISGGLLQMVNHGLATGALFAMVGMLYERYHTREIAALGGLGRRLPVLTFFFVLISLASIGLPGLNGFVGEFLVLVGMFRVRPALAVLAAAGIILGAFYMLWLVQRVFFGPVREPESKEPAVADLGLREIAALAPVGALCLWIGLYPNFFLARMQPAVDQVVQRLERSGAELADADAGRPGAIGSVRAAAAQGLRTVGRSREQEGPWSRQRGAGTALVAGLCPMVVTPLPAATPERGRTIGLAPSPPEGDWVLPDRLSAVDEASGALNWFGGPAPAQGGPASPRPSDAGSKVAEMVGALYLAGKQP